MREIIFKTNKFLKIHCDKNNMKNISIKKILKILKSGNSFNMYVLYFLTIPLLHLQR